MRSLPDLQDKFTHALFTGADAAIADAILADAELGPARRLDIYRNNVLINYRNALRDTYPVVVRLVGDDFFNAAARLYAKGYPSQSGDLHDFGEAFGDFLAEFPPAQGLPYLPDVARLEWAVHRAFHAADCEPMDAARLATIPEEQLPRLRFSLNPTARLIESAYPVARIWQVNQPDYQAEVAVSLDAGGAHVLVIRRGYTIEVEPLSAGEFTLLGALRDGITLGDALALAMETDAALDLGKFLESHILRATLTEFSL